MNQIVKANMVEANRPIMSLTEDEICAISGGNPILVAVAGAAGAFAALNAAESFGEKLGKALYYALN